MKKDTKDWVFLAEEDLKDARIMYENKRFAKACYFAQQSIEKLLKAFLVENEKFDIRKHRTHNLVILLEECKEIDETFEELEKLPLSKMSIYAVEPRYNLEFFLKITEEDAKEAIEIAERVREFVLGKLKFLEDKE